MIFTNKNQNLGFITITATSMVKQVFTDGKVFTKLETLTVALQQEIQFNFG